MLKLLNTEDGIIKGSDMVACMKTEFYVEQMILHAEQENVPKFSLNSEGFLLGNGVLEN